MAFFCIACKTTLDPAYRACPHCGEPVTDFLRQYLDHPIDGKYQLLDRLGAGGMGEVYKVLHVHLSSVRVIKLMRSAIAGEQEAHERFLREARLATKIHHQNVATLHDFSSLPDGSFYMVWEYIEGKNLTQLIRERGRLTPRYAAIIAAQALLGLDAVHRAGIVHRDISPDNIMISRDEQGEEVVKIIDLGIAKGDESFDQQTRTGMFVGKWKYCSPEHLGVLGEGERIDGRADIYSFGIVMYEMLTGAPPFVSNTPQHYMMQHAQETPKAFRIVNPAIENAPELEALIFRALEKDRNQRFPTARHFARELELLIPRLDDSAVVRASDAPTTLSTLPEGFSPTARTPIPGGFAPTARTPLPANTGPTVVSKPVTARTPIPQPQAPVPVVPVVDSTIRTDSAESSRTAIDQPLPSREGLNRRWLWIALVVVAVLLLGAIGAVSFAYLQYRNSMTATATAAIPPGSGTVSTETTPPTMTGTTVPASQTVDVTTALDTSVPELTTVAPPATTQTSVTETAPPTTTTAPAPPVKPAVATQQQPAPAQVKPGRKDPKPARPEEKPKEQPDEILIPFEDEEPPETPATAPATTTQAKPAARGGLFGRLRRGAKPFTGSSEFKQGFVKGIIPDYSVLSSNGYVQWAWVADGVKLASYHVVVSAFRDLMKASSAEVHQYLEQTMQLNLDDVTLRNGSVLRTSNAVFWLEDGKDKKRGIGIEMIFRDGDGRTVAMLRHTVKGDPAEAAEEAVDAVVEFVEEN